MTRNASPKDFIKRFTMAARTAAVVERRMQGLGPFGSASISSPAAPACRVVGRGNSMLRCIPLIWIGLSVGVAAHAGLLPFDQAVEVMKEQQGADAEALARQFGTSDPSALVFNSFVDSASMTFGYSIASGSTYEGQALSLTAFGAYDSSTGEWQLSSSGDLGGQTWTTTGSYSIVGDPQGVGDWVIPIGPGLFFDYHVKTSYTLQKDNTLKSDSNVTFTINNIVIAHLTGADTWAPKAPKPSWTWSLAPLNGANFRVDSSGVQNDGLGTFTMQITAVPEPAAFALLGFGLVGLGGVRRRR